MPDQQPWGYWTPQHIQFFIDEGLVQGDPEYWVEKLSNPDDPEWVGFHSALVSNLTPERVRQLSQEGAIKGDPEYWVEKLSNPDDPEWADFTSAAFSEFDAGGGTVVSQGTPDEETTSGTTSVGSSPITSILLGSDMKWYFDPSTGNWAVSYGLPNSDRRAIFEASPDQMNAIFGEGYRPVTYETETTESLIRQSNTFLGGNIGEVAGEGSFDREVQEIIAISLETGTLPEWAQESPEVLDLLYLEAADNRGVDWLIEEIAKTDSFKQRFPGIGKIKDEGNLTTEEAIDNFLNYEGGLRTAMKSAGYDAATVTSTVVGGLIQKGYSLETATNTINVWKRMEDFRPALESFNQILAGNGKQPIGTDQEFFDFLSGEAPADFYDLWEASSFLEASTAAGLEQYFSAEDAMRSALETSLNPDDITAGMQTAARTLLRMRGELDLGLVDLDREEIIDLSLGIRPRSGRTLVEINEELQKAVSTAQRQLSIQRGSSATSYGEGGVPQAVSLRGFRRVGL